jgi:cytochrome c oxidase subunit II
VEARHHDRIATWERRWIALSGLMSLTFVILIAYSLATEGGHIAQVAARGTPESLLSATMFAEPGVRVTAPGAVQVSLVAQAFSFSPERVQVPVGAEVTFYLTARDVIHGWQVERTNLNVIVIPGEIAVLRYTFTNPGRYRVTCNEYCGIGHQNMLGEIEVVTASAFGRAGAPGAGAPSAGAADAGAAVVGAAVDGAVLYAGNCGGCHGPTGAGIVGTFPPLASHAAELAAADRGYLADAVLYGLQGPIEVSGRAYDGFMPAWSHLDDDAVAAILNHLLTLGGPEVAPYPADEVAAARGKGWTPSDVLTSRHEVIGR